MFAAGVGLFVVGYALIWTGVERFRGKDYSILSALGVAGGGTVTPDDNSNSSSTQPSNMLGTGPQAVPATTSGTGTSQQGISV